MTNLKLTILASILFATGMAHADYLCTSYDNETSLSVNENYASRVGNASVLIESATEKKQIFGVIDSGGGLMLRKIVVNLFPFQGDTLTIVSKPQFCGRGSCDFDAAPVFTAVLKIGETQTHFSCNETNF